MSKTTVAPLFHANIYIGEFFVHERSAVFVCLQFQMRGSFKTKIQIVCPVIHKRKQRINDISDVQYGLYRLDLNCQNSGLIPPSGILDTIFNIRLSESDFAAPASSTDRWIIKGIYCLLNNLWILDLRDLDSKQSQIKIIAS